MFYFPGSLEVQSPIKILLMAKVKQFELITSSHLYLLVSVFSLIRSARNLKLLQVEKFDS